MPLVDIWTAMDIWLVDWLIQYEFSKQFIEVFGADTKAMIRNMLILPTILIKILIS